MYDITAATKAKPEVEQKSAREIITEKLRTYMIGCSTALDSLAERHKEITDSKEYYPVDYKNRVEKVLRNIVPPEWKALSIKEDFYFVELYSYYGGKIPIGKTGSQTTIKKFVADYADKVLGNRIAELAEGTWKKYLYLLQDENGRKFGFDVQVHTLDDIEDKLPGETTVTIKSSTYQIYTTEELKEFSGHVVSITPQFVTQLVNIAAQEDSYMLPITAISLGTAVKEKFKKIDKVIKLPDASFIRVKFTDRREEIKKALGTDHVPEKLSKYRKPPKEVMFNPWGQTPDYIVGTFPNIKGELKQEDYFNYQYKIATALEVKQNKYDKEVEIDGKPVYLKRVELVEATEIEAFLGQLIWTDFDNEILFYYNREGEMKYRLISGYQDLSEYDIDFLAKSYLNVHDLIYADERFGNFGSSKEWGEFGDLYKELKENVNKYTNSSDQVDELLQYKISKDLLRVFPKGRRMLDIYYLFISKYAGAYAQIDTHADDFVACYIDVPEKGGYDIVALRKKISEDRVERIKMAADREGVTPGLPKNIKNFNPDITMYPQQALAIAMGNIMDISMMDVDMGGGKTGMMVADICNKLTKKAAKRPLIICPDKTIAQNKEEIEKRWTQGRMNVFVINTETFNLITDNGANLDKLKEAVEKMPPNTIYMSSYKFLALRYDTIVIGQTKDRKGNVSIEYRNVYTMSKYFIHELEFDMIYLDESHHVKNPNSLQSEAIAALSGAKIKRITSGTMVPNDPNDLFAQLRFLDPTILGRQKDFLETYAKSMDRNGKVSSWQSGAQKRIRELIQGRGGISIRRSMWRWRMPELEEKLHYVTLTKTQQELYNMIMDSIKLEMAQDKKIAAAYKRLLESNDEFEDTADSEAVLAKLSKFTSFLVAPSTSDVVQKFIDDGNELSKLDIQGPKIAKMNEILKSHFSGGADKSGAPVNGKVIIFCQRNDVAQHIIEHMDKGLAAHAVWYNANRQSELFKFKEDNNCWIIVAVDMSLKEGQNLQIANRIIRMDIHWSPGDMDQSYARAFRNGQKKKVNVDIILCDGTMEICKYMRLVSKEHINRKLTSDFDDDTELDIISMSLENMDVFTRKSDLTKYEDRHKAIQIQELAESKLYEKKYASYEAKGISRIGSKEDIEGSAKAVVPELRAERMYRDEEGNIKVRRSQFDAEDIGTTEGGDSVKDTAEESGIHLYFMEIDGDKYLVSPANKTSHVLKTLKFTKDSPRLIRQVKSVEDVDSIAKMLKRKNISSDIEDIRSDKDLRALLPKARDPQALAKVKKYYRVSSAKQEAEFFWQAMEGGLFVCTENTDLELEGFVKMPSVYWKLVKSSSVERIVEEVNSKVNVANKVDLEKQIKILFGKKVTIDSKDSNKTTKPAEEGANSTKAYDNMQIAFGILLWAKDNKKLNSTYKIYVEHTGDDFKDKVLERYEATKLSEVLDTVIKKLYTARSNKLERSSVLGFWKAMKPEVGELADIIPYFKKVKQISGK